MTPISFPDDFLFGTATAALQIEGGDKNNNWYDWSEKAKIEDGSHSVQACDHWNRIEEDVELIKGINSQTYRMGIEWGRIIPSVGKVDEKALEKYRFEVELLLKNNIKPLVTLWHFSQPLWIEAIGGWVNPKVKDHYLDLVKIVVEYMGDVVSDWITLNEPNVYLLFAYFEGTWPPGKKGDLKGYFKAAGHFIEAHQAAYKLIHSIRKKKGLNKTSVGAAHHLRVFHPLNNTWLERRSIGLISRVFQNIFLEGMTKGKVLFPIKAKVEEMTCSDFVGVNYYSRDIIKGSLNPAILFGERLLKEGCEVNDLNWEIYPEGIYQITKEMYQRFKLPIFITENGTCDKEDAFRKKYIRDHLVQLHKAISEGVPILRYYHWTLMDNFEWVEGNAARFGLYHNDFDTQKRTLRDSGLYYAKVSNEKKLY